MLRQIWKTPAYRPALSSREVVERSAAQSAPITTEDQDLALIEAALFLHGRALIGGCRSPGPQGLAGPVVAPCLVLLTGKAEDRALAAPSDLELVLQPGEDSGWRSECVVHPTHGRAVHVELVTARTAPIAHNVTRLSTPTQCLDSRTAARLAGKLSGRHAARTAALHRLGQIDRAQSDRQVLDTDRVFALGMSEPRAETAPSALAALWSLLNATEAEVPFHPRNPPAPCLRRLHVFSEIETGMLCTISTELFRGAAQAPVSHSLRSSIRRIPDGATLAVCETVLR